MEYLKMGNCFVTPKGRLHVQKYVIGFYYPGH